LGFDNGVFLLLADHQGQVIGLVNVPKGVGILKGDIAPEKMQLGQGMYFTVKGILIDDERREIQKLLWALLTGFEQEHRSTVEQALDDALFFG